MAYVTPAQALAYVDANIVANGRSAITGPVLNSALTDIISAIPRTVLNTGVSYFIAMSGSDTTGDGSEASPWATLQHALNWVSANIDGGGYNSVTLYIGEGTFVGAGIPPFSNLASLGIFGAGSHLTTLTNSEYSEIAFGDCIDINLPTGTILFINALGFAPNNNAGIYCGASGQAVYLTYFTYSETDLSFNMANSNTASIYSYATCTISAAIGSINVDRTAGIPCYQGEFNFTGGGNIDFVSVEINLLVPSSTLYYGGGIIYLNSSIFVQSGGNINITYPIEGYTAVLENSSFINVSNQIYDESTSSNEIYSIQVDQSSNANGAVGVLVLNSAPVFGDGLIPPFAWQVIDDSTDIRIWVNTGGSYIKSAAFS